MMLTIPGVYMIRNTANGAVYVGSSQNVHRRCGEHVNRLESGRHPDAVLQQDWATYGRSAFQFTLLEPTPPDTAKLSSRERHWQLRFIELDVRLYGQRVGGRTSTQRTLPGLRRLRTLAALSQGELAERAGMTRQTINRLENGGEAEMPTVRKLATALECTPAQLIEPET